MQKAINFIAQRLARILDYLVILDRVTLSEAAVFFITGAWFIWFAIFENIEMRIVWIFSFAFVLAFHATAVFNNSLRFRVFVFKVYAFVWLMCGMFTALSDIKKLTFPTAAVLFCLSLIIAIRLNVEYKTERNRRFDDIQV